MILNNLTGFEPRNLVLVSVKFPVMLSITVFKRTPFLRPTFKNIYLSSSTIISSKQTDSGNAGNACVPNLCRQVSGSNE